MESANLDQFEKTLTEQQFLGGQLPTNADREAYEQLKSAPPSAATHPHTFAWFTLVQRFQDSVRATWGGAAPAKGAQKPAAKQEAKKEEAPKTEAPKDGGDDDMDLFGDDEPDEEAKKALEEQKKKNVAAQKKAAPIAKSFLLFEVKPYEAETDLDALFVKIIAIEMDGLVWKQDNKKEPIAYGVYKLIVGCVIEDDKVSVDDLQEAIQAFEEEVQSVDILSFNKI